MINIQNIITYIFLFTSLYFEVFILITYLENRENIKKENKRSKEKPIHFPSVSIIVPAFNEEMTIAKTMETLLNLEYPKDKLKIIAVDDGSIDNTFEVMKKFEEKDRVKVFRKENGGKHTALNFAIEKIDSDLIGALDADSYVDRDALKNIVLYFEEDKNVMAVIPSVKIYEPKNILQMIQKVEYGWGVLLRKMLSYLGAVYVTPGPFSIFKREVFEKIGGYKNAYNTEDMEMAMRMQKNKMKIVNAHNASIYTVCPDTLRKLLKQRLRWTYGFIKNTIDYKNILFKKEYGNLGIFILPMASISIVSAIYILSGFIYKILYNIFEEIIKIQTIGLHFNIPRFEIDWFFLNTEFIAIISFATLLGTFAMLYLSRKMTEGKFKINMELIYFLTLYTLIAPLWLARAVFKVVTGGKTTWR